MMAYTSRTTPQSTTLRLNDGVSRVRSQTAFVRALLDEVERVARPGWDEHTFDEQLVEELARLGSRCIEIAGALTTAIEAHERASRC